MKCVFTTVSSKKTSTQKTLTNLFICLAPFQYEIVAIVDNEANINNVQELRGSKLCHPGHGLQSHWTEVLANVGTQIKSQNLKVKF